MSFPLTPTNGQTAVLNGITYSYSTSTTAWTRVAQSVTATSTLVVTGATTATSTNSGALQVIGGVGVGGNLYVGGSIIALNTVSFTSGSLISTKFQAYTEAITTIGTVTGATNINCQLSNVFDVTLGASPITFTFINPPASGTAQPITIILRQDGTGNRLATFTNAKYSDGITPVLSTGSNQVDVLTFFTVNGGAFWFGTFAMANVS